MTRERLSCANGPAEAGVAEAVAAAQPGAQVEPSVAGDHYRAHRAFPEARTAAPIAAGSPSWAPASRC